jgi:hypothetical protein
MYQRTCHDQRVVGNLLKNVSTRNICNVMSDLDSNDQLIGGPGCIQLIAKYRLEHVSSPTPPQFE